MRFSPKTGVTSSSSKDTRSGVYVDTSALGRVLLGEPASPAIRRDLARYKHVVSSRLLRVELRRLAMRANRLDAVTELLAEVALMPLDEAILTASETVIPANVGTLDAIHLATATYLAKAGEVNALITYDKRLAQGAQEHGITVLSPSAEPDGKIGEDPATLRASDG